MLWCYPRRSWKADNSLATDVSGANNERCSNHFTAGVSNDVSVTGGNVVNTVRDGSNRNAIAANGAELRSCIVPATAGAPENSWDVNNAL